MNTSPIICCLKDEAATVAAAERLAAALQVGDVLLLHGDLGAGKTTFTRGLVRGGGSPASVSSPTFTLVHEYMGGRFPIIHVDAYRLTAGVADAESIGLTDYLAQGDALVVIEWPERVASVLPTDRLEITLEDWEDGRRLTVSPVGATWDDQRRAAIADTLAGFPLC